MTYDAALEAFIEDPTPANRERLLAAHEAESHDLEVAA